MSAGVKAKFSMDTVLVIVGLAAFGLVLVLAELEVDCVAALFPAYLLVLLRPNIAQAPPTIMIAAITNANILFIL
jgi:hypothetical protein